MKITIEAETCIEEKQFPKTKVITDIFEFAIYVRYRDQTLHEDKYSHLHITDAFILEGRLRELIARLINIRNTGKICELPAKVPDDSPH